MLAFLCYIQSFPFSFVSYFFQLWKEKYLLAEVKVFPLPKMFPPCAEGKVLACKGEWWQPEGGCASLPMVWYSGASLPQLWYSGLWWPLLGTNNPYNRSSGPPCRLLCFCTPHSIICHSESYWGLMGNQAVYNQGSRLLIRRLFLVHLLVQSSSGESSRIVLKEIILYRFCRSTVGVTPAVGLISLLIRFALETTISRWPPPSSLPI